MLKRLWPVSSMTKKKKNDLGVKIGTKEQSLWDGVLKNAKVMLEQAQDAVIIQSEIIKLAEKRIAEEKEKL